MVDKFRICPYCKKDQSLKLFRKNRRKCTDCERDDGRKYRKSYKGKEKSKVWLLCNKNKMVKLQASWYQNNKKYVNEKNKKRIKEDFSYRCKCTARRVILLALQKHDITKNNTTVKYIQCKISFLAKWLAHNFDKKMSKYNHGDYWHIDHVIPINTFDLNNPEQRRLCFGWYNTSPIYKKTNLSKHDKVDQIQLMTHMHRLLSFSTKCKIDKFNDIENENDTDDIITIDKDYIKLCATYLVAGKS